MELLKDLQDFLDSEEGKKSISDYALEIKNDKMITESQLERAYNKFGLNVSKIIDKIIKKYNSDAYYNRWMSRGAEPEDYLYDYILLYAEKYGEACTDDEIRKYANIFTTEIYKIDGKYVQLMQGQGSIILID